jgi:hypothetical protein
MPLKIIILCLLLAFSTKAYSQKAYDLSIFDKDKVLSIISVNYFYNKKALLKNSKITCELNFRDDYKNKVITKIDENSNYLIILSNPGKVFLESIQCSRHSIPLIYGASRFKEIDDMGFVAHAGFVNYVGELNLNYFPSFFKILDIFNLSNFLNDKSGTLEINIRDNIFDALNFINLRFNNIYHLKLTKSILEDSYHLKPNDTPEPYSQENINKDLNKNTLKEPMNSSENIIKKTEALAEKNIEESATEPDKETIKQKDLLEKLSDKTSNNSNKNQIPRYPYLAPQYSDFYSPIYNPYNAIGNHFGYYMMDSLIVQDPVIEHPH